MKTLFTTAAATVLALTIAADRSEANPAVQIGTTFGTFSLGTITTGFGDAGLGYGTNDGVLDLTSATARVDSVDPNNPTVINIDATTTNNVNSTFNLFRGSFNDLNGGPVDAISDGGTGAIVPNDSVNGGWFGSSVNALRYAVAFADAITRPVDRNANLTPDIEEQDTTGVFAPEFPITDPNSGDTFLAGIYAFAYEFTPTFPLTVGSPVVGTAVNTISVIYDGVTATVQNLLVTPDTPSVNADQSTAGLGSDLALYYVTPEGFRNPGVVPEIDGPVLVQVGFALMGLYVLMLGRRRREDEMSGNPLAA